MLVTFHIYLMICLIFIFVFKLKKKYTILANIFQNVSFYKRSGHNLMVIDLI